MRFSKLNQFLSTFNLFLIFVGYQLVTSLLLPNYASFEGTEEGTLVSRNVTIPYRIFALGVSLIVLILNWRKKVRPSASLKCYFIFWILLIIRIVYDLYIRIDIVVNPGQARETMIFVFFVCLIPALSVYKSLSTIDFQKAFNYIFWGHAFLIPVFFFNNPLLFSLDSTGYRLSGNIAMNTIAFGHYGVTLALLAFYWGTTVSKRSLKLLSYFLILIGSFVMLRSGSRGPLIAFAAGFIFYYVVKQRTSVGAMTIALFLLSILYALSDFIFDGIRAISPTLAARLTLSGYSTEFEEFSTGRSSLYDEALNSISDSPLWGNSFAIFNSDGSFIYSHNMIIDAFMALGVFGGILFVIMIAFAITNSRHMVSFKFQHWWIALLCIQYIIYNLFSGAFYQSATLNALLVMTLFYTQNRKVVFS